MSLAILSLKNGALNGNDQDIVSASQTKTTIVKALRFVNVGANTATLDVRFVGSGGTSKLLPLVPLPSGFSVVVEEEITLGANNTDKIVGKATGTSPSVDFVASGIQRDA